MEQSNIPGLLRLPRELRDEIYTHLFPPITSLPVKAICRESGMVLSTAESQPILKNVVTNQKVWPNPPTLKEKLSAFFSRTKLPADIQREEAFAILDKHGRIQEIGCRYYNIAAPRRPNVPWAAVSVPDHTTAILRTNRQISTEAWEFVYGMIMKKQVITVTGHGEKVHQGPGFAWGNDPKPPIYSQEMYLQPTNFLESEPFLFDKFLTRIPHLSGQLRKEARINRLDISFKEMTTPLYPQRYCTPGKDVEYLLMTLAVDPIRKKADIIWCLPRYPDCSEPESHHNMSQVAKKGLEQGMSCAEILHDDNLLRAVWFAKLDYHLNGERGEWRRFSGESGHPVMYYYEGLISS